MRQDALDHRRIFEAGNDLHLPATGCAGFYLDLEHALQSLGLSLIAAWRLVGDSSALTAGRRPRRAGVTSSRQ